MTPTPPPRAVLRAQLRDRSRAAARTAVLTVALPSVATLGVFAAAAVVSTRAPVPHQAVPVPSPTPPAQPVAAKDVADRADRAKARADLAQRQQAEQQHARESAQASARPRTVLPVDQHGLSATYGEIGTHWSARHTGIDFPVPLGTPVHAVTDGTVSTRWNPAYGYMSTVAAPDGTLTWYCHLGSYRIRKGQVHAGDVIAYSGSSGNSTGPHLHFEVHPGGAGPVDPLPWLLAHGLDPR